MKHQVAGLNGVYRDLSIETSESFWILFQPSSINGDAPHQDYYFITVDFMGKTTEIKYDSHGKPDKGWDPQLETDVFKSSANWGIELTIPLNDLNIPFDCSSVWKMNIMYNLPLEEGNSVEGLSTIQAWYPTLKDEKNPGKSGRITSLEIDFDKYAKNAFERRAGELSDDISALKGISKKETDILSNELSIAMTQISPKKYSSNIRMYHSMDNYEDFYIEVNKPVKINGWKIYQTGYDERMGRWSETSIIELVRDPWLTAVYIGIFMILFGTLYLIWMGKGRTKTKKA